MKSIRAKLNMMTFLMLGTAVGFGYLAYKNNTKMERIQTRLSQSLQARDLVQDMNIKSPDKKIHY